jgi:hypothetical protein
MLDIFAELKAKFRHKRQLENITGTKFDSAYTGKIDYR